MELRSDHSKTQTKLAASLKANKVMKSELAVLQKKAASDCDLILQNVKDIEHLDHQRKQEKAQNKTLQRNLKQAAKLFQTTLAVKLRYEEVIEKLVNDPITAETTLNIIRELPEPAAATASPRKTKKMSKKLESSMSLASGSIRSKTVGQRALASSDNLRFKVKPLQVPRPRNASTAVIPSQQFYRQSPARLGSFTGKPQFTSTRQGSASPARRASNMMPISGRFKSETKVYPMKSHAK